MNSTKKDRKFIIWIIVMIVIGLAVSFAGTASLAAAANAADAAKQALVGDAEIITGEGSADGFAGPVNAVVEYAGDIIVGLTLSGDAETPDIGGAAMTTLKEQILASNSIEGIDVVSGATYTSKAVISAVKAAMGIEEYVMSDEEVFEEMSNTMLPGSVNIDAEYLENILAVKTHENGKHLYMVQGVGHYPDYPFKVAILLDAEGRVENIGVVYSHETDGFGTEVLNDGYWVQYFGADTITRKTGGEGTKIDVVSGATETSVGLYDCVKNAFAQFEALK